MISIFLSDSTLSAALPSWCKPITALTTVRPMTTRPVPNSCRAMIDTRAAPSSTSCMRSRYWRANAFQPGSFASSASLFGPYFARRAFTSAVLSPTFGSTESRWHVSSIERVCHSTGPWSGAAEPAGSTDTDVVIAAPLPACTLRDGPDATTFRSAMHEWRPDQSGIEGRLRGCVSGRSTWGSRSTAPAWVSSRPNGSSSSRGSPSAPTWTS